MNLTEDKGVPTEDDRWEQAVEWFLRVRSEAARIEDLPELRRWIEGDSRNALAYQQVSAAWGTVGDYASAPEIVMGRRDALEDSHAAGRHRSSSGRLASRLDSWAKARHWVLAACLAVVAAAGLWWVLSPSWTEYSTELGQRRTVTLSDASVIVLDADSRVRVRYTEKERAIALERGQAHFAVAKDPLRPFRVRARDQTVVALGTQFDVELISQAVLVTLIEGHIAVAGVTSHSAEGEHSTDSAGVAAMLPPTGEASRNAETGTGEAAGKRTVLPPGRQVVELTMGEALRVHDDGRAVLTSNVDLARATAWQQGKLFFDNEPLSTAVERINRYTREPVEIDPSVAAFGVSGVFNAGDTDAFIEAVTSYFPVEAIHDRGSRIYLTRRN